MFRLLKIVGLGLLALSLLAIPQDACKTALNGLMDQLWIPVGLFVPAYLLYVYIKVTIKGWPKTDD